MKRTSLLLVFSLCGLCLMAQNILNPAWVKSKTTNAEGWGVDVDANGDVYWPVSLDSLNQGLDIVCYKYDANGNTLWASPFFYGGAGTQHSYVVNAKDTALYIGGRSCSGLINTCNMMLLKVNKSTAALQWDRTFNFNGNGYDEVDGLEVRSDGIYCGGWAQELQSGSFQSDLGLWKLDFAGNTQWTNHFGKMNTAEHQDGHFVVDSNYIYAAGLWSGGGIANLYNGHGFLGRFDRANGNFVDSTLLPNQANTFLDIENALGMTSFNNELYVTGYTTPPNGTNGWQIFVAKFDKSLNQLWYATWGSTGTESARGIAVDNGIVYIAGVTESPSLVSNGKSDALLLRFDTSGNFISHQTWGNQLDNSFRDISAKNNILYLSGSSTDVQGSGAKEAFLLKVDFSTSLAEEKLRQSLDLELYPNPAQGELTIDFRNSEKLPKSIRITNLLGKQIKELGVQQDNRVYQLKLETKGIFFIEMNFDRYTLTRKVINQ